MRQLHDTIMEGLWNVGSMRQMEDLGRMIGGADDIGILGRGLDQIRDWLVKSYGMQPVGRTSTRGVRETRRRYILLPNPKGSDKKYILLIDPVTDKTYEVREEGSGYRSKIVRSAMHIQEGSRWMTNNDRTLYILPERSEIFNSFCKGFIEAVESPRMNIYRY